MVYTTVLDANNDVLELPWALEIEVLRKQRASATLQRCPVCVDTDNIAQVGLHDGQNAVVVKMISLL